jgi:hypothetical protein
MCLEVIKGNVEYASIRQLAGLVGGVKNIVFCDKWIKDYHNYLDSCLCQVDIEKTLQKAGFQFEFNYINYEIVE